MSGCQRGSAERSRSWPRLATLTRVAAVVTLRVVGSWSPLSQKPAGATWTCMSGASRSSRVRQKAPPSPTLLVSGPRPALASRTFFKRVELRDVGGVLGVPDQRHRRVVVEVLPDALQVRDDVDAVLAQVVGRADAGQHEQLRRVHRAAGEDHLGAGPGDVLAALADVGDPDRAAALDHDPGRRRRR